MKSHYPEVSLLYLALVQKLAIRALDVARRLFFVLVVLATGLIALEIGAIDSDQVTLLGLKVDVQAWVPLGGLSALGLVLLAVEVAHYERGHRLAWQAVRLYSELGFAVPHREWHTGGSPFSLPYSVLLTPDRPWGRWLSYRLASFIGTALVTALTFISQALVWNRFRVDHGWTLAVCLFAIVPLGTITIGVLRAIVFGGSVTHRGPPWS